MGVLTDFVVAKREQAEQVGRSPCPYEDFDGVSAKGLNPDTLAALYSILSGEPHDVQFMDGALLFPPEQDAFHGARWVFEVPQRLVLRLAAIEPKRLRDVASVLFTLRADAEFAFGWSVEEVRDVVAEIAALCRQAVTKGESLLMWICL
jgi:hypothetical protein